MPIDLSFLSFRMSSSYDGQSCNPQRTKFQKIDHFILYLVCTSVPLTDEAKQILSRIMSTLPTYRGWSAHREIDVVWPTGSNSWPPDHNSTFHCSNHSAISDFWDSLLLCVYNQPLFLGIHQNRQVSPTFSGIVKRSKMGWLAYDILWSWSV